MNSVSIASGIDGSLMAHTAVDSEQATFPHEIPTREGECVKHANQWYRKSEDPTSMWIFSSPSYLYFL